MNLIVNIDNKMSYSVLSANFSNGRIKVGSNQYVYDINNLVDDLTSKVDILKTARIKRGNENIYYVKRQLNKGPNGHYLTSTIIIYDNVIKSYVMYKPYRLCETCFGEFKNWNGDCVCVNCNKAATSNKTITEDSEHEDSCESEKEEIPPPIIEEKPKKITRSKSKKTSVKEVTKKLSKSKITKPPSPKIQIEDCSSNSSNESDNKSDSDSD